MAKKKATTDAAEQQAPAAVATDEQALTTLQKIKQQAREDDTTPAASLRFRDILGGDYLWALVRHQIWLILLVVAIITTYVAVRYQCQQDTIDINRLEKELVDAKFQSLSSSSNLTRMSRQSNVIEILRQYNDTLLKVSQQPPYIIEVPE